MSSALTGLRCLLTPMLAVETDVANQMGGQASRIAKLIDTCVELEEKRKNEKSETFLDGDLIAFEGKLPPLIHCLRHIVFSSTSVWSKIRQRSLLIHPVALRRLAGPMGLYLAD